jgi:GDP-4-dehydro-6-deoxy-D-mannose reductase
MRALVTGGGGFVGTWLQAALQEAGHEVVAPSSVAWDVREAQACHDQVARAAPEMVFHLAARTRFSQVEAAPETAWEVQVTGTRNLLDAVAKHAPQARLIVVSSCHVYGLPQSSPVGEDHPLAATRPYGKSKVAQEDVLRSSTSKVDWVIVRPFLLTGPGQPQAFAPADWAAQAAAGVDPIAVGNLQLTRDYLDVRDCVRGLLSLARTGAPGGTYNLCSGKGVALSEVFRAVAPGCTPQARTERLRPEDPPSLIGDPRRALSLGWSPEIPLAQSFSDLVQAARTG